MELENYVADWKAGNSVVHGDRKNMEPWKVVEGMVWHRWKPIAECTDKSAQNDAEVLTGLVVAADIVIVAI